MTPSMSTPRGAITRPASGEASTEDDLQHALARAMRGAQRLGLPLQEEVRLHGDGGGRRRERSDARTAVSVRAQRRAVPASLGIDDPQGDAGHARSVVRRARERRRSRRPATPDPLFASLHSRARRCCSRCVRRSPSAPRPAGCPPGAPCRCDSARLRRSSGSRAVRAVPGPRRLGQGSPRTWTGTPDRPLPSGPVTRPSRTPAGITWRSTSSVFPASPVCRNGL